jgi:uncharacterized protein YbjT (DUF2867 family)
MRTRSRCFLCGASLHVSDLFSQNHTTVLTTESNENEWNAIIMDEVLDNVRSSFSMFGDILGLPNFDAKCGLIFVTGGNGPVGHRVAKRLLRAGYAQVRLGAHHVSDMEDKSKEGADIVEFNWNRPETYENSLTDVESVFCTAPYHKNWKEHFGPFLDACKRAGVRHIVKFSFYHARRSGDPFQNVPLVRDHGDCDEMIVLSGIPYTILSSSHLMSNPLVFQGKNLRLDHKPAVLYGSSANNPVNYVSPNDVAECAVKVLLEPARSHRNKEYTLTGDVAITEQEVCQLLSDYLEKPIMYVDQPLHTFKDTELSSGDPEWMIEDLATLEMIKASGYESKPSFATKDIETICGREPETYAMYLCSTESMSKVEEA